MTRFSIDWPILLKSGSTPVSGTIGQVYGEGWTMKFFPMGYMDSGDMCVEISRDSCNNKIFVKGHIYIFQGINYAESKSAGNSFIEKTLQIGQKNILLRFTGYQKIFSRIEIRGSLTISSNEEDLGANETYWETERNAVKQFLYQPTMNKDDTDMTYSFSNFYELSNTRLQAYNGDESHCEKAHPMRSNGKMTRSQSQPAPFTALIGSKNENARGSSLCNDASIPMISRTSCSSPTPQSCSKENNSGSATPSSSTNKQSSSTGQNTPNGQKYSTENNSESATPSSSTNNQGSSTGQKTQNGQKCSKENDSGSATPSYSFNDESSSTGQKTPNDQIFSEENDGESATPFFSTNNQSSSNEQKTPNGQKCSKENDSGSATLFFPTIKQSISTVQKTPNGQKCIKVNNSGPATLSSSTDNQSSSSGQKAPNGQKCSKENNSGSATPFLSTIKQSISNGQKTPNGQKCIKENYSGSATPSLSTDNQSSSSGQKAPNGQKCSNENNSGSETPSSSTNNQSSSTGQKTNGQKCSKEKNSASATASSSTNNQSTSNGQKMSMEEKSLAGLACDFLGLRKSGQFSDATLRCGTKEFKVHKTILSIRSPVLAKRFVNETGTLVITDLEPEMLDMLLDYIYSGKLPELTVASVKHLLPATSKYQLGMLKDMCMEHFESSMSIENVLDTLAEYEGNDEDMKMLSVSFICRNFNILQKTELWKLLKKSNSDLCMEVQEHVIEFMQVQRDM